jgi:hypothetical protein
MRTISSADRRTVIFTLCVTWIKTLKGEYRDVWPCHRSGVGVVFLRLPLIETGNGQNVNAAPK